MSGFLKGNHEQIQNYHPVRQLTERDQIQNIFLPDQWPSSLEGGLRWVIVAMPEC